MIWVMNSPQNIAIAPTQSPAGQTIRIPKRTRKTNPLKSPQVKRFLLELARHNNATEAYLTAFPHITKRTTARQQAYRLLMNVDVQAELTRQRAKLERLADAGIERVAELMAQDSDLQEAGRNARFVIEQTHGKATQKIESKGLFVTVNYDLTGNGQPIMTDDPQVDSRKRNVVRHTDVSGSGSTKPKKSTQPKPQDTPPAPPPDIPATEKKDNR